MPIVQLERVDRKQISNKEWLTDRITARQGDSQPPCPAQLQKKDALKHEKIIINPFDFLRDRSLGQYRLSEYLGPE